MAEARACLQYLADNGPAWIKSLDELRARIQRRQNETARVAVPAAPKVKKTSSNESLRHSGLNTSSPSTGLELTSVPQAHDSQHTAVANGQMVTPCRKRKTASLLSTASGIHKYRSRASVTVYYDSEVQDVFDRLVRNISTGRNNIRKSRMVDRVAAMAGLRHAASQASSASQNRIPMLRAVRSTSGMPSFDAYIEESLRLPGGLAGLRPPPVSQLNTDVKSDIAVKRTDAREQADSALDRAQGFCEKGAHQFLRDGDCSEELAGAKAAFEEVVALSLHELEKLDKEAETAALTSPLGNKDEGIAQAEGLREAATDMGIPNSQRAIVSQSLVHIQATGLIEADDDPDEDEDDYGDPSLLPSPPFRLIART